MSTLPILTAATALPADADALVVVAPSPLEKSLLRLPLPAASQAALQRALGADRSLAQGNPPPAVLAADGVPGGRLVLAPAGALDQETDDVRAVAETAAAAVTRAVQAGARRPALAVLAPDGTAFEKAREVAALAALGTAWDPLEAQELRPAIRTPPKVESVAVIGLPPERVAFLEAVERGRELTRQLVVGGPERMAPPRAAELCVEAFAGTGVTVTVEDELAAYPLAAAVGRASSVVPRHRPRIVTLELAPDGPTTRTLLLAGKGITYDTGGADVKTHGGMAGMSRDKGGAAAVAGLLRTLAGLRLPGLRVIAQLGFVRNSIGEESYVSDEVIVSRGGVRVRIGNTDAEGRLVLADLLAALKERAASAPRPTLVSVATLTGHAYRAFGPYVAALENGAARKAGFLRDLAAAGEAFGEPLESTRPRREDYLFVAPKLATEDVLSANRLASVDTPRGHQGPYAFLDVTSGLRGSGLPFVHLDIAGVVVSPPDWQAGRPTGSPVLALAAMLAEQA